MKIEALLIDIDGVLTVGGEPVPGAQEAIGWLNDQGIRYRFVSNSTQRTRMQIAERLNTAGFTIDPGLISTPIGAALAFLERKGITRCSLLVTDAATSEFHDAGIIDTSDEAGAVIIGDAGLKFTFRVLNEAFRLINDGALFIALERDRYWMAEDGLTLAAGPFVAALEYACGRSACVMGKPSPDAFLSACAMLKTSPGQTAMIGDDIRTDVGGAQEAGLIGILVRTGKYSDEMLRNSNITPDFSLPSIAMVKEIFG
ncbi:MAG: TIGR01458 family HAD-type hydrolase [Methanocalculus sp. MSAO_Arc2]|uniref:TIGR01458 family HAD-type hydrolase n=1 Tax=Methanocalculus sp. MSAO_Arc2 TaxID=2293855 RepID=UPI000FF685CD|nr:MAG: TIGR01458 family HAD-type hydrolase [Methanocalculus sp. MSAO_Arc2]